VLEIDFFNSKVSPVAWKLVSNVISMSKRIGHVTLLYLCQLISVILQWISSSCFTTATWMTFLILIYWRNSLSSKLRIRLIEMYSMWAIYKVENAGRLRWRISPIVVINRMSPHPSSLKEKFQGTARIVMVIAGKDGSSQRFIPHLHQALPWNLVGLSQQFQH